MEQIFREKNQVNSKDGAEAVFRGTSNRLFACSNGMDLMRELYKTTHIENLDKRRKVQAKLYEDLQVVLAVLMD